MPEHVSPESILRAILTPYNPENLFDPEGWGRVYEITRGPTVRDLVARKIAETRNFVGTTYVERYRRNLINGETGGSTQLEPPR